MYMYAVQTLSNMIGQIIILTRGTMSTQIRSHYNFMFIKQQHLIGF